MRYLSLLLLGAASLGAATDGWNAKAAASYLDGRADWWSSWPQSKRDHDTYCISCHTAVPYALGRASLRSALRETAPSASEAKLVANVESRVRQWKDVEPFYKDSASAPNRSAESRGTEAVLNALVLGASGDKAMLRPALDNMWAAQIQEGEAKGAFLWIDFHNRPWEADDSPFYGAALAAIAAGSVPADLRRPDNEKLLAAYLKREFPKQSMINQTVALWASAKIDGVLSAEEKSTLVKHLAKVQNDDGSWSLIGVAGTWKRRDSTDIETTGDGYATGLVTYALLRTGTPADSQPVAKAVEWLAANQSSTDGRWPSYSLNKKRDLNSDVGRFMADAATGYAVLALTAAHK